MARILSVVLAALLAFVVTQPVVASSSCTTYTIGGTGITAAVFYSLSDAESAVKSAATAIVSAQGAGSWVSWSCSGPSGSTYTCSGNWALTSGGTTGRTVYINVGSAVCPTNPCSSYAGSSTSGVSAGAAGTYCAQPPSGVSTLCEATDGFGYANVAGQTLVGGTYTGGYCGSQITGNVAPSSAPTYPASNCILSGGVTSCVYPQAPNCGTINGNAVCANQGTNCGTVSVGTFEIAGCIAQLPAGQCEFFGNGDVACASDSSHPLTTPPAPASSSAPTSPATPDSQLSFTCVGGSAANPCPTPVPSGATSSAPQVMNYYSSTTLNGSSVASGSAVAGTGAAAGTSSVGNASGSSSSAAGVSSSGSGSASSSSAPTDDCGTNDCTGAQSSAPSQDSIATTTTNYMTGIGNAPIVQAFSNIGTAFNGLGAGTCPTAQFEVFGATYTIDEQCTLFENVADVVGVVMMILWGFVGFRVIASA